MDIDLEAGSTQEPHQRVHGYSQYTNPSAPIRNTRFSTRRDSFRTGEGTGASRSQPMFLHWKGPQVDPRLQSTFPAFISAPDFPSPQPFPTYSPPNRLVFQPLTHPNQDPPFPEAEHQLPPISVAQGIIRSPHSTETRTTSTEANHAPASAIPRDTSDIPITLTSESTSSPHSEVSRETGQILENGRLTESPEPHVEYGLPFAIPEPSSIEDLSRRNSTVPSFFPARRPSSPHQTNSNYNHRYYPRESNSDHHIPILDYRIPGTYQEYVGRADQGKNEDNQYPRPFSKIMTPLQNNNTTHSALSTFRGGVIQTLVIFIEQIYLTCLLRLPALYWSRVDRIFTDANLTLQHVEQMAQQLARGDGMIDEKAEIFNFGYSAPTPAYIPPIQQRLKMRWEIFIDSLMREWKTFNIISALLLSAILTIFQIDGASTDPVTRYLAFWSMISALLSLLYGCIFIIRFSGMRKLYKALEWAQEAKKNQNVLWNVWIMLAMPLIWLTWSILTYIVCIMAFMWRVPANFSVNDEAAQVSPNIESGFRIFICITLGFGVLYGILIMNTLRHYGTKMDESWKARREQLRRAVPRPPSPVFSSAIPPDRVPTVSFSIPPYPPARQPSAPHLPGIMPFGSYSPHYRSFNTPFPSFAPVPVPPEATHLYSQPPSESRIPSHSYRRGPGVSHNNNHPDSRRRRSTGEIPNEPTSINYPSPLQNPDGSSVRSYPADMVDPPIPHDRYASPTGFRNQPPASDYQPQMEPIVPRVKNVSLPPVHEYPNPSNIPQSVMELLRAHHANVNEENDDNVSYQSSVIAIPTNNDHVEVPNMPIHKNSTSARKAGKI